MGDKFDNFVVYGEVDDFNPDGSLKSPNGVPTVIMLSAPWCGHCKTLKPSYADAAERMKGKVRFMTLQESGEEPSNVEGCKMMSKIINLKGFPTIIKLNKEGKILGEFDGQRTVDGICDWVSR